MINKINLNPINNDPFDIYRQRQMNQKIAVVADNKPDKFESSKESEKREKIIKYSSIAIGSILVLIALIKRENINKFIQNLFNKEEKNILSELPKPETPNTPTPEIPKEEPPISISPEKPKEEIPSELANGSLIDESKENGRTILPKVVSEEIIKTESVTPVIPKLILSKHTEPIREYLSKYVQPIKEGNGDEYCYLHLVSKNSNEILDDITNLVKVAEKEEIISLQNLIDVFNESIRTCITPPSNQKYEYFNIFHKCSENKKMLKDLIDIMHNTPQKQDEKINDYMLRIVEKRKTMIHEKDIVRQQQISSQLVYSEDKPEEKIKLTEEDRTALINKIKKYNAHIAGVSVNEHIKPDHQWKALAAIWRELLTMTGGWEGSDKPEMQKIEKACMQRIFTNYKAPNYEPVYRWLHSNDQTVHEIPNVGEIYKYNKMQSCSKNKHMGEEKHVWTGISKLDDRHPDSNVKFIIHPKSKTSKAYSVGKTSYGDLEVIYPANIEFKILDKRLVEYVNNSGTGRTEKSFYRWIVEMQEV